MMWMDPYSTQAEARPRCTLVGTEPEPTDSDLAADRPARQRIGDVMVGVGCSSATFREGMAKVSESGSCLMRMMNSVHDSIVRNN